MVTDRNRRVGWQPHEHWVSWPGGPFCSPRCSPGGRQHLLQRFEQLYVKPRAIVGRPGGVTSDQVRDDPQLAGRHLLRLTPGSGQSGNASVSSPSA